MNKTKNLGCEWLNYGLYLTPNKIFHCCTGNQNINKNAIDWSAPIAIDNLSMDDVYNESFFNQIIESKKEYINKINNGIVCECTGCTYLYENYWDDKYEIRIMGMAPDWTCNANCHYCMQYDHTLKPVYNPLAFLNGMIETIMDKTGISAILWSGGEFTIQKQFEDIFALLDKHTMSSNFTSSGIVYSDIVTRRLNEFRHSHIVISIDSGTKETYKKIKRVDQFDKVLATIKNYSQNIRNQSRVGIKYIILPENSSKAEIDNFFKMLVDNNLTKCSIILDVNFFMDEEAPSNDILVSLYYFAMKTLQLQGRYPYIGYGSFRKYPWLEQVVKFNNSEFIRRSFETMPFGLSNYYIVKKFIDIVIPLIFRGRDKNEALNKISYIIGLMKKVRKIFTK